MNSKEIGNIGEKIAQDYLQDKGYKILDRNYSFRIPDSPQKGEIDIVVEKEDTISFVEVKTLIHKNGRAFQFPAIFPEDKVDFRKQRKIIKTAQSYLLEKKYPLAKKWQIDVLAIEMDFAKRKAKIRHIKNAVEG